MLKILFVKVHIIFIIDNYNKRKIQEEIQWKMKTLKLNRI